MLECHLLMVEHKPMDKLFLRDFRLQMIIGIYEWERKLPQTVQLDLEIGLANNRAYLTDNVDDSINYAEVAQRIKDTVLQREFQLVETLAEHIAQLILTEFKAPWTQVSVTKIAVVPGIQQLGICIERSAAA